MSRKVACWAAFLLCACALAVQAASAPATDLDGFLTSLRAGVPMFKEELNGSCSVNVYCDSGAYLYCSSPSGDCHSDGNSVTCDGVRQECPSGQPCTARTTCLCYGNVIECSGWVSCHDGFDEVTCDGATYTCSPPWWQCPQ